MTTGSDAPSSCGAFFDAPQRRKEFETLDKQIAQPDFWQDQEASQKILTARKRLSERMEEDDKLAQRLADVDAYFELAREGEPVEGELRTELEALRQEVERIETETILAGENDHLNAIVAIHPGAGGTESQDWAEMLLRMYKRWTERHGFAFTLNDYQSGEEAGLNPPLLRWPAITLTAC